MYRPWIKCQQNKRYSTGNGYSVSRITGTVQEMGTVSAAQQIQDMDTVSAAQQVQDMDTVSAAQHIQYGNNY